MSGGDDAWRAQRAKQMADMQLGEAIARTYQHLSWAESVALRCREAAWQHERASLLTDCARLKAERDTVVRTALAERAALLRMTARALQAETHLAEARAALVELQAERELTARAENGGAS